MEAHSKHTRQLNKLPAANNSFDRVNPTPVSKIILLKIDFFSSNIILIITPLPNSSQVLPISPATYIHTSLSFIRIQTGI